MTDTIKDARAKIVEYLKAELIGPCDGETETVEEYPYRR